jgi:hypothetical protein
MSMSPENSSMPFIGGRKKEKIRLQISQSRGTIAGVATAWHNWGPVGTLQTSMCVQLYIHHIIFDLHKHYIINRTPERCRPQGVSTPKKIKKILEVNATCRRHRMTPKIVSEENLTKGQRQGGDCCHSTWVLKFSVRWLWLSMKTTWRLFF